MKKYYRTYITTFTNNRGTWIYAGMHESKYENPADDPYVGSGKVIRATYKKYGKSCIVDQIWFDHETDQEMRDAECKLVDECKSKYSNCVNIAEGGLGNSCKFLSEEERIERCIKIRECQNNLPPDVYQRKVSRNSKKTKEWHDNMSPEDKKLLRENMSSGWNNRSDERKLEFSNRKKTEYSLKNEDEKIAFSECIKAGISNMSDEDKLTRNRKISEKTKIYQRKSDVWSQPLYGILYDVWLRLDRPKRYTLQKYCKAHGITELNLNALTHHFEKVYVGEEQSWV